MFSSDKKEDMSELVKLLEIIGKNDIDLGQLISLVTTESSICESVSACTAGEGSGFKVESGPILVAGSASVTSHGHETQSCASMITQPTTTASSSGTVLITLNLSTYL